jgi:ubiquinone/menaquinone biosynthesis C-methylase UbiE
MMPDSEAMLAEDWAEARGAMWLAELDLFEQMLESLGAALLERAALQCGQHVADIGCGGGRTSRLAARLVAPGGSVHGIDIAPMLMAEAARRAEAEGLDNLRFSTGDAASFLPEGAPFDRLLSRFGVMFFTDPAAAFANLRRLLKDGGLADFAVWAPPQDNLWMNGARGIVAEHVELPAADPLAPGPFSLADPERFTALLQGAGFTAVDIAVWQGNLAVGGAGSGAATAAEFALRAFPFAAVLEDAEPGLEDMIRDKVKDFYRQFETPDGVAVPGKAWLVRAMA